MSEFMHKVTHFLGGGKKWVVKGKVVYLWPFIALGIFLIGIFAYDYFLA